MSSLTTRAYWIWGLAKRGTKFTILNFSILIVSPLTLPQIVTSSPISNLSTTFLKLFNGSKIAQFTSLPCASFTLMKRWPPLIILTFDEMLTSVQIEVYSTRSMILRS